MGLWFGSDPNAEFSGVEAAPDPSKQAYTPGTLNPSGYTATQIGSNALAGANGDAGAKAAQRQALLNLQQQAKGGLNASDKASLNSALGQAGQANRGEQGAILQGAQNRGALNSGATLAAQLQAQQGTQEAGANAAVDAAGQAAQRAQAANTQAAQLGGQMDTNAFNQQATVGQAQNQINATNAGAANKAAEFNAQLDQLAKQFNISNDVEAKKFLAALLQQKFSNQLGLAQAKAGVDASNNAANMALLQSLVQAGGNAAGTALSKAHGGYIDGKANVPGDSVKNDTVPIMASPGEIVIPRSAANSFPKAVAFLEKEMGCHYDNAMQRSKK